MTLQIEKENEIQKSSSITGVVVTIIAIVLVVVVAAFVIRQKNFNDYARTYVESIYNCNDLISEYEDYSVMKMNDGKYIYYEPGAQTAISKISTALSSIDIACEYIDHNYSKSRNVIDKMIHKKSGFDTWEEYRTRISNRYFIDSNLTLDERAKKIVDEYVSRMTK